MNRLKTIVLASLAILLLAAASFTMRGLEPLPDIKNGTSRSAFLVPATTADSVNWPHPGSGHEAVDRPIFEKSRRPARSAPDSADPGATAPAAIKLIATAEFHHKARAFMTSSADPDGHWILLGETLDGWTIQEITSQAVTLSHGGAVFSVAPDYGAPANASIKKSD